MYMCFYIGLTVPSKCPMCKIYMNMIILHKYFPYANYLFPLCYRIGRNKSSAYRSILYVLGRLKIPSSYIINIFSNLLINCL